MQLSTQAQRILDSLCEFGILLHSDATLPSVVGLITGEPVRGSWWGHPRGKMIFQVSNELGNHPDVLFIKLVSGKITLVHRPLWPDVVAIGTAREPWQMDGLSRTARALLDQASRDGVLHIGAVTKRRNAGEEPVGNAVRQLESRLLVYATSEHTESGAHAKVMESWEHWKAQLDRPLRQVKPQKAKTKLETVLAKIKHPFDATATLPWQDVSKPGAA